MRYLASSILLTLTCWSLLDAYFVQSCSVGDERLKSYVRSKVKYLLNSDYLEAVYWPEEPLSSDLFAKSTGLNVSIVETQYGGLSSRGDNNSSDDGLIEDITITCSNDRERTYSLVTNLELVNPFNNIHVSYETLLSAMERTNNGSIIHEVGSTNDIDRKHRGHFTIKLPRSTFLVQLNQRIRYDECMAINYVQLAPNVNYEMECKNCSDTEQRYLDRVFGKRMTQIDSTIDSLLSGKMMLGLRLLLNQQRLDLELLIDD